MTSEFWENIIYNTIKDNLTPNTISNFQKTCQSISKFDNSNTTDTADFILLLFNKINYDSYNDNVFKSKIYDNDLTNTAKNIINIIKNIPEDSNTLKKLAYIKQEKNIILPETIELNDTIDVSDESLKNSLISLKENNNDDENCVISYVLQKYSNFIKNLLLDDDDNQVLPDLKIIESFFNTFNKSKIVIKLSEELYNKILEELKKENINNFNLNISLLTLIKYIDLINKHEEFNKILNLKDNYLTYLKENLLLANDYQILKDTDLLKDIITYRLNYDNTVIDIINKLKQSYNSEKLKIYYDIICLTYNVDNNIKNKSNDNKEEIIISSGNTKIKLPEHTLLLFSNNTEENTELSNENTSTIPENYIYFGNELLFEEYNIKEDLIDDKIIINTLNYLVLIAKSSNINNINSLITFILNYKNNTEENNKVNTNSDDTTNELIDKSAEEVIQHTKQFKT